MDDDDREQTIDTASAQVAEPRTTLAVETRRRFFAEVIKRTRAEVESDLDDFEAHPHAYLLKLHFQNERIHYEVALHVDRELIEVGLHFEDGPVSSSAYLHYFDQRIVELKDMLGTELELERWTSSWGRVFYLVPLLPLDAGKAKTTGDLLSRLIDVLQPLVKEANVPRERVDQQQRGPWRSWKRGRG